jgi:uncharacterized repeat protein (TIGR03803 family)
MRAGRHGHRAGADAGGSGTTWNGYGLVFKVGSTGQQTALYAFSGGNDGGYPGGDLLPDKAGNLYGTTEAGGLYGAGVVYKLDPAGNEAVLHNFMCGQLAGASRMPAWPSMRPAIFYGTTFFGGPADSGVVYKLNALGNETILFNFLGGFGNSSPTGGNPYDSVILGPAGNFVWDRARRRHGEIATVYKLDNAGNQRVLNSFTGGADGGEPVAGVIRARPGIFIGPRPTTGRVGEGLYTRSKSSSAPRKPARRRRVKWTIGNGSRE